MSISKTVPVRCLSLTDTYPTTYPTMDITAIERVYRVLAYVHINEEENIRYTSNQQEGSVNCCKNHL